MQYIKGAYSLLVMSPRKITAARDPFGFKPLCLGKRDDTYVVASETCALDTVGAEFIRDLEPGEIITITEDGVKSNRQYCNMVKPARCILNISTLQDRTVSLTMCLFSLPESWQEEFLLKAIL